MYFGCNGNKRPVEPLDAETLQMLLHALGEPQTAEEAAATDGKIEQPCNSPDGEGTREGLEFVELACKVATADERADRCACNHADIDAFFVEGPQHADMGPAASGAAAKGNRDLWSLRRCRRFWWCC